MNSTEQIVVSEADMIRRQQAQFEVDQMINARLRRQKKSNIFTALVAIVFVTLMALTVEDYFSLPVAYVSWKTGKITYVEDCEGQVYTNPYAIKWLTSGRYEKVWVK